MPSVQPALLRHELNNQARLRAAAGRLVTVSAARGSSVAQGVGRDRGQVPNAAGSACLASRPALQKCWCPRKVQEDYKERTSYHPLFGAHATASLARVEGAAATSPATGFLWPATWAGAALCLHGATAHNSISAHDSASWRCCNT